MTDDAGVAVALVNSQGTVVAGGAYLVIARYLSPHHPMIDRGPSCPLERLSRLARP